MTPKLTNLLPNLNLLEHGTLKVWFSYQTPIAFQTSQITAFRHNDWGTVTGRHLNHIRGMDFISGPEFESRLQQVWPTPSV